jgi:hypothetical protein
MTRTVVLLSIFLSLLPGSSRAQTPYQLVTLPSGKEIKVLGMGKIVFSQDKPALMLKYQTDLSLDDKPALREEVEEIWASFRINAEKEKMSNAIISANELPKGGLVSTSRSYNFVFRKSEDGTWHTTTK